MKCSFSICLTVAIVITLQAFCVCKLSAQDKDRDAERADRDHERRLRDAVRTEQWKKKFNVAEYLKGQDTNKDGVLSPEEMAGRRTKPFLEKMGIPTSKTSKIEDLVKKFNSLKANEAQQKRKDFERRLNNLNQFGVEQESFGVAAFGTEDKSAGVRSFEETATGLKAADFEPDILKKADKIFGTFDRDENGFLDGDEILRLTWKSPPPETSDLNRDGRLSKMELANRYTLAKAKSAGSGTGRQRGSSGSRTPRDSPKVTPKSGSRDRGIGSKDRGIGSKDRKRNTRRPEKRDTSLSTTGSAVAKAKANARSTQGYAKYVDRSFKKYDANSDGKLDKEEIAASSLLKKAKDIDGDGFISKQEAINLVSGGKVKAPSAPATNTKPSSRSSQVRRTSATASNSASGERSPLSGIDANADGQIQMHEFTSSWTVEKLEDFREKDKNGDGLLSPAEYRGSQR